MPGSTYNMRSGNGLNEYFTFTCDSGSIKQGSSMAGGDNVTCQENGRWDFGNLTCQGTFESCQNLISPVYMFKASK